MEEPRIGVYICWCGTNIAKMVDAPIFHVNGDDPEAVVHGLERVVHKVQEYLLQLAPVRSEVRQVVRDVHGDGDGLLLRQADRVAAQFGAAAREEMLGRQPTDFMTEASARRIVEEFRPALRRIGRLDNKPVSFVAKSGEVVDCTTNAIVEHDRSGAYLSTIALYVEAGEETRADFRYRTLYRSMPAMLHTLDAEGRILTVTDHWLRKLGYEREEVVGRTVTDFYSEADRARFESDAALREVISRGDFNNVERQMVTKSGNTLDIVMSAISHRDHRGDRRVERAPARAAEHRSHSGCPQRGNPARRTAAV